MKVVYVEMQIEVLNSFKLKRVIIFRFKFYHIIDTIGENIPKKNLIPT